MRYLRNTFSGSNRSWIRNERRNNTLHRDFETQTYFQEDESEYPSWWTCERLLKWLGSLPEDTLWNCFIGLIVLVAIVGVIVDWHGPYADVLDITYNAAYTLHVLAIAYSICVTLDNTDVGFSIVVGFILDIISYLHYALSASARHYFKLLGYYLRLHRPFRYLLALDDYNLKGSVLGTTLKYCYIFFVLRVTWVLVWVHINEFERQYPETNRRRALYDLQLDHNNSSHRAFQFLTAFYIINKMFIPIGPSVTPANDVERITCLLVMLSGCLVVSGVAVASLSLVIGIYMRPEETFRERYRLIIKEMKESDVPPSLREKVETFYKMYWHKQKAVSATRLLPTYPPTLPNTIFSDIYFEATQKSRVLRDLSYPFLTELAKKMQTIHYIPGDPIIKRSSRKSTIIYISYGDIEMLSAEDDCTAMLRMTRGTVLSGWAACVPAACARAHVDIRAATFCTTLTLQAHDLWLVALKYGRNTEEAQIIHSSFVMHFDKVRRHYYLKKPEYVKHKSSIFHFKRNLMALKEAKDTDGNLILKRRDMFLQIAGSYIMRNRADSSQADETDAICLRPTFPCILQPSSSLQLAWQLVMSCVIVTVAFTHPYYLVFKEKVPVEFRCFDYVVTALHVLDIMAYLSTGANVEEGVPITFTQTSSQQMRSRWFILDVVGTAPIFEFILNGHFAGINKLLRLPKVFRVLKSLEEICVYHSHVVRFLSYTLLLIIACYLIAALQQGFMCFQFRYCVVSNFTHSPYWENKTLDENMVGHSLTFGLYWAISMITFTAHMETWGLEYWNSILYTMVVVEICTILHIFIEAVYSATIMVTAALREDYDFCIGNVKNFLIRNQVDPALRQRFITYLRLCWYTDKAYSMTNKKKSIFYDLPPHVYQDIVTRQRSKYLLSLPFMKLLKKEDLKNVSSKAKLFHTSPNEILLNTGDISNEMYVIKQGICEILDPMTKTVVGWRRVKQHFGVLECLLRLPAYYTVRAVTHVQVFSISMKVLGTAIELPQIKDAIDFAKEQPEYSRLLCRRESFLLYEPPAPTPNREYFPLPRKYEMDFDFLHPFNRLGFFSILRYMFPRYTIRPDGGYLKRYEWFRALCALLSVMVFPSYTYLQLQWPGLYILASLLDIAAYFDIIQRMLVGYFDAQGVLVYHPLSTATHYLKGAFIVDLFGCLPLENMQTLTKEMFIDKYRLTKNRQILMLNRLLQLYRFPSAMLNLDEYIERRDILLVIRALPVFLVLLNTLTCLVVFSSVDIFWSSGDNTWRIVPLSDDGGSWLNHFDDVFRFNMTDSPWNLHLAAYFWVVYETTTTGYSCFKPSNFDLMEVLFVGMVIGALITTYFSVRIISVRCNVNQELAAYQKHMKDIAVFMRRESLDFDLKKEVLNYYAYNWEKTGGVDYNHVLKLCDQITLRTDAILHIYGPTFEKCPFLSNCDVSLVRMIGRAVRGSYFLRGMPLVQIDDVIDNMYFVDYGVVSVKAANAGSGDVVILTRGSVFGNLEKASTVRCPMKFEASSKVHVLQIKAMTFHNIISDFPEVAKEIEMNSTGNKNKNYIAGNTDEEINCKDILNTAEISDRSEDLYYVKNKFLQLYLIIISLCSIYADVYNAGFQNNSTDFIFILYALDVGFCLKILIYYCFPHVVDFGHSERSLTSIRKSYLKHEFKYDLLSCAPIELLCFTAHDTWMAFCWLRLNRIFRIVTVYKCLKRYRESITVNLTLSTIFSLLIWLTLFTHIITCLWYFLGLLEENSNANSSWMYTNEGGSWCDNLYICSMYFVLTTFTQNGVGDIMPKNHSEVIFVSILQIISTLVFMVYVGEFSNIVQFQSFGSFSFYSKYLELQEFLKNNRVSKNLVTMVNRYTLHLWREARGHQLPYFLQTAPPCLKLRVMSAAYMQHLVENPVFEDCELAFLRQLVGCLQLYTYNEDMYVVEENEITDSMYIIHTGRVLQMSSLLRNRRVYTASESFNMEQGLTYNKPCPFSYRTLIKSQVLTLRFSDWEYLLKHFPKSKDSIYKYMKQDYPPDHPGNQEESRDSGDKNNNDVSPETDGSPETPLTINLPLGRVLSPSHSIKMDLNNTSPPSSGTNLKFPSTGEIPQANEALPNSVTPTGAINDTLTFFQSDICQTVNEGTELSDVPLSNNWSTTNAVTSNVKSTLNANSPGETTVNLLPIAAQSTEVNRPNILTENTDDETNIQRDASNIFDSSDYANALVPYVGYLEENQTHLSNSITKTQSNRSDYYDAAELIVNVPDSEANGNSIHDVESTSHSRNIVTEEENSTNIEAAKKLSKSKDENESS